MRIGDSGSEKINRLLSLLKHKDDDDCNIDKVFLYVKDAIKGKNQYFLKKCEKISSGRDTNLKVSVEILNDM